MLPIMSTTFVDYLVVDEPSEHVIRDGLLRRLNHITDSFIAEI